MLLSTLLCQKFIVTKTVSVAAWMFNITRISVISSGKTWHRVNTDWSEYHSALSNKAI